MPTAGLAALQRPHSERWAVDGRLLTVNIGPERADWAAS